MVLVNKGSTGGADDSNCGGADKSWLPLKHALTLVSETKYTLSFTGSEDIMNDVLSNAQEDASVRCPRIDTHLESSQLSPCANLSERRRDAARTGSDQCLFQIAPYSSLAVHLICQTYCFLSFFLSCVILLAPSLPGRMFSFFFFVFSK